MSILIDVRTRVVVQGMTGHEGSVHAKSMLEYGTRVVEVNVGPRSLPEFVDRWITGPLAELGFAIREVK